MTALEKELVEALEYALPYISPTNAPTARRKAEAAIDSARAKQTGTHEFVVTDDGHGRAMVGGRRLAYGGMGIEIGNYWESLSLTHGFREGRINVGTRVRVELRDGVDFATLVEVLP